MTMSATDEVENLKATNDKLRREIQRLSEKAKDDEEKLKNKKRKIEHLEESLAHKKTDNHAAIKNHSYSLFGDVQLFKIFHQKA
jgi:predicted  nucleic acid-binding Zn-ribbon protein|mmetsp:Transcript_4778/g.8417  ORF Transcript_4778/g.8417 Transcript_4778/m.8417 type:complete len:84 (-) Transcript_4778:62-313(-)|eukprot:CAMPEP_0198298358 /NCGR_PEP_ID=MMETSP1449-20131203/40668_1 /TAXON_ID=420275 /ORGANISM="Attheya septentrionalis, Strain CCMP2084" /LENGTH=83 /DNA_ID=CAMNT_0043999609 /DNA_START=101 /DNA_END=352 /DNA_ORIENTATION=-